MEVDAALVALRERIKSARITYYSDVDHLHMYGIPRGGAVVAGLMRQRYGFVLTDDPSHAEVIVDDIVDSGATRERYQEKYGVPVFSLVTAKPGVWTVFPWEGSAQLDGEDMIRRMMQFIGDEWSVHMRLYPRESDEPKVTIEWGAR